MRSQRDQLWKWRIRARQIGVDVSKKGVQDDNILPLLHRLSSPTLFTSDAHFYVPSLCHPRYCLVFLAVGDDETALYVRLVLSHPAFKTKTQRLGTVSRVIDKGITSWRLNSSKATHYSWTKQ